MKRKYIFNWEIKSIANTPCEGSLDPSGVAYWIELNNGVVYITNEYREEGIYTTFLVQPENIIDDIETVIIN